MSTWLGGNFDSSEPSGNFKADPVSIIFTDQTLRFVNIILSGFKFNRQYLNFSDFYTDLNTEVYSELSEIIKFTFDNGSIVRRTVPDQPPGKFDPQCNVRCSKICPADRQWAFREIALAHCSWNFRKKVISRMN